MLWSAGIRKTITSVWVALAAVTFALVALPGGAQAAVSTAPLAGSARQVCATPNNYPQFETCIDVVNGAVVAKGYTTVGSPNEYVVLTGPNNTTVTGPGTKTTAGQTTTLTGPAPATTGKWCATHYIVIPAAPNVPLPVSGSTPPCLTV